MLLKNKLTRTSDVYALCALMCFHLARLDTKTNSENELLDLKNQDRTQWYFPLIELGNTMMHKAVENSEFSCYHYEAAIAAEHLKAPRFENTNWDKILYLYQCLNTLQPMPTHLLTMAVVCLQKQDFKMAENYFEQLKPEDFGQRSYLFYGAKSDYFSATNEAYKAIKYIDLALNSVINSLEKEYLIKKKAVLITQKK